MITHMTKNPIWNVCVRRIICIEIVSTYWSKTDHLNENRTRKSKHWWSKKLQNQNFFAKRSIWRKSWPVRTRLIWISKISIQTPQKSKTVPATFEYAGPAAFASTFSGKSYFYKLQNCWTLNCDTDIHVCNDRRRFDLTRVASLDDMIMIDKIIYAIESYETMNILIKELNESMSIKLLNVTLAPDFLTNLVCLSKFTDKKVHWNIENNRLHRNESTFCHTQSMSGHWILKKNPIDQNQASIDLKSDKRSFQAFAIIIIIIKSMFESIIIESTSSKQKKIKLASNHQNAADFQISMKKSQHLIIELIFALTVELTSELTVELISELITELTSELNTELFTALNHEMNFEIETSESYETAANNLHSISLITIVLKLREYVEREHLTSDENRLIMSHASIWWWWSDDAVLRYKSYLRNDSMTSRIRDSFLHLMISFESSLIFMQWFRIEIIISIIISIIIRCLSVINKHEDEMTESTTSKQCDEDKIRSSCSKMSFDWWRSFWVDELITSNIWDDCLDWMKAKMTI